MHYEAKWEVLENLMHDLRKSGETIPSTVMEDLRSAKTIIEILKSNPTHDKITPQIDTYMRNVEAFLIFAAQKKFSSDYVERWIGKLEEAEKSIRRKGEAKHASKFVPGLPRSKPWVRIQISGEAEKQHIQRLAEKNELLYKEQNNDHILLCGEKEKIKNVLKRLGKILHRTKE